MFVLSPNLVPAGNNKRIDDQIFVHFLISSTSITNITGEIPPAITIYYIIIYIYYILTSLYRIMSRGILHSEW